MSFLFKSKKSLEEIIKENKIILNRSIRELNREKNKLERSIPKILNEIKKHLKNNQMDSALILSKDLIRIRNNINNLIKMQSQIKAFILRLQTIKSSNTMSISMNNIAKSLRLLNSQMSIVSLQKIICDFEKQNEIMDIKEEITNESINNVVDDDINGIQIDDETKKIIDELSEEIGIDLNELLPKSINNINLNSDNNINIKLK